MDTDICLVDCGHCYEYISVYFDDLLIASKYPQTIVDTLNNEHNFKLKGNNPIYYHLGYDFGRNENGTLHFAHRKHIDKMDDCYFNVFGSNPKLSVMSPLEKGDHPEL